MTEPSDTRREFEQAARTRRSGLVGDLWGFLRHNKKWWLLPIIVAILLLGLLVFLSSTSFGWAIYPLF